MFDHDFEILFDSKVFQEIFDRAWQVKAEAYWANLKNHIVAILMLGLLLTAAYALVPNSLLGLSISFLGFLFIYIIFAILFVVSGYQNERYHHNKAVAKYLKANSNKLFRVRFNQKIINVAPHGETTEDIQWSDFSAFQLTKEALQFYHPNPEIYLLFPLKLLNLGALQALTSYVLSAFYDKNSSYD